MENRKRRLIHKERKGNGEKKNRLRNKNYKPNSKGGMGRK